MTNSQEYFASGDFHSIVSDLGENAGFPAEFSLKQLEGGRNNRVFCIDYENGARALLKAYFQHPNDKRLRLKAEYSFLDFAWGNGIRCIPRPLAADYENNLGLYEYIDGNKVSQAEVDEGKVTQALNFFLEINKHKNTSKAGQLPVASEACFSINDNFAHVIMRIERLKKLSNTSEISNRAISFVHNELTNEWKKSVEHAENLLDKSSFDYDKEISREEMRISPSDFGFHNAILKENKLYFIDFEYAGWDDPAKMVCDFFCQPEIPVPSKYFNIFISCVADNIPNIEKFKQKIKALMPLYRVKWCCILLNEFLDVSSERRNFAYGKIDFYKIKSDQLEKAIKYLESDKFD